MSANRPLRPRSSRKVTYHLPCDFHPRCKDSTCENIQMSVQSSSDRAVQEKLLTICHAISIQDAITAHVKTFKCQPNRP
eukprot:691540-Hanusia_phi.AAC.1